jgi:hypothetical protein
VASVLESTLQCPKKIGKNLRWISLFFFLADWGEAKTQKVSHLGNHISRVIRLRKVARRNSREQERSCRRWQEGP